MFSILFLKFYYIFLILLSLRPTFMWTGFYNHCSLVYFSTTVTFSIPQDIRNEAVVPHIKLNTPLLIPLELLLYFLKHTDLLILIQISKSAKLVAILT